LTESVWLPGLIVLGIGFVVGVIVIWRLRGAPAKKVEGDLELRVADLAARRDDLYDRLRSAVGQGDEQEVERLEIAAARVLKSLEELSGELPAERAAAVISSPVRDSTAATGWASKHPLTVGFLFGAGLVGLVALLFYWAVQDAGPRPDMAGGPVVAPSAPPVGGGGGAMPEHNTPELPPEAAARVAELEQILAQSPDDLQARRELSLIWLQASRYVEAFQQAQGILDREPKDLDALYVQGVVRLTMGQMGIAKGLFDQVIELYPQHVRARVARGAILFRLGDRDGAIADWEAGVAASGGSQPEIEALLAQARAVDPSAVPSAATATPAAPSPNPAPAAVDGPSFGARIELQGSATPGSVLFVSLRGDAPGPPAAVRRIDAPSFPLEITLTSRDSMLGRPLPESVPLSVRLDGDGSASTRDPSDLSVETPIRSGERVELVLQ